MNATQLACPSCGAGLQITENATKVKCEYCGKESALEYSQGQATLLASERVGQAITNSNVQVSDTIRSASDVTQLELKRLQITQDISSSQMLLASVRSEIRSLERQSGNKISKKQLKELRQQEMELTSHINTLQSALVSVSGQTGASTTTHLKTSRPVITWKTGLGWAVLVFLVVALAFTAIDQNLGSMIGLVAGVAFYFWYRARRRKAIAKQS